MDRQTGLCGVLVAWLVLAGCSAAEPTVVTAYRPSDALEAARLARLMRLEEKARPRIARLREEAEAAQARYFSAAEALHAPELPPEVVRPTSEQVEKFRKEATAAWRAWRIAFESLVAQYQTFFARYPRNWYARHRLASFFADSGLPFYPAAAEQWEKVIEMEPRFVFAYNNLGTLYNHMGRDMEAVDLYLKSISIKPDDPMFYLNLAVNYSTHRQDVAEKFGWDLPRVFRECIAAYRKARELAPDDAQIAYDLASQYILAKYFGLEDTADEAVAAWNDYLRFKLSPRERSIAYRNVGRIYLKEKNDPRQAIVWLEGALALTPGDPSAQALLDQARAALAGSAEKESATAPEQE